MKIAVLFPGQGSQSLEMGKEFRTVLPDCREMAVTAEKVSGLPLTSVIDNGPMEELTRSSVVQPAITLTNLICWQAIKNERNITVEGFAGHSLGEYSALFAAGVLSFDDAITLVTHRGLLMGREGDNNPGGMRAVIGLTIDRVAAVIDGYTGEGFVQVANHNTPEQIVISGNFAALDAVSSILEQEGARVIALNVSAANHSPLVGGAVADFQKQLDAATFSSPDIPVYFNVSAARETDPAVIKEMMARQIISPVRWCEIITAMLEDGFDTFIEVGPKTVLKAMMRKIVPKGSRVASFQVESPETLAKCLDKLEG